MTPSERERRIEAATKVLYGHRVHSTGASCATLAREAFDAADEAVPVVPATWDGLLEHLDALYPADVFTGESGDVGARLVVLARKLSEAEVAARDFANALCYLADRESWLGDPLGQRSTLHGHFTPCELARDVLARHPSFSGEEGTEG